MRRLGRNIFRVITGFVLVLWLGLIALWIRSHWRGDSYLHVGPGWSWLAASSDGGICLAAEKHGTLPGMFLGQGPATTNSPMYPEPGMQAHAASMTTTIRIPSGATALSIAGTSVTTSTLPTTQPGSISFSTGALTLKSTVTPAVVPPSGATLTQTVSIALPPAAGTGSGTTSGSATLKLLAPTIATTSSLTISGSGVLTLTFTPTLSDGFIPVPANPAALLTRSTFHAYTNQNRQTKSWVLIVPFWSVLPGVSLLVVLMLWRERSWRRRERRMCVGLCAKCGYDLRATPDRCPECGTIPDSPNNVVTTV